MEPPEDMNLYVLAFSWRALSLCGFGSLIPPDVLVLVGILTLSVGYLPKRNRERFSQWVEDEESDNDFVPQVRPQT